MIKKILLLLLFPIFAYSQTTTTVFVGHGYGFVSGVSFHNPITPKKQMTYTAQYIERNNRRFVQNNVGVAYLVNHSILTTSAFFGLELNNPNRINPNGLGVATGVSTEILKGIELESRIEWSKTINLYLILNFKL